MSDTSERLPNGKPGSLASYAAALFAFLLISVVLLLFRANDARQQAVQAERHPYDVLVATRSFETAVARAEASLGMFVVASNPCDGTRYHADWLTARRMIIQVSHTHAATPTTRNTITQLKALYVKQDDYRG